MFKGDALVKQIFLFLEDWKNLMLGYH